jgi:hypothetical protein
MRFLACDVCAVVDAVEEDRLAVVVRGLAERSEA